MDAFSLLIGGFCAMLGAHDGDSVVGIGYVRGNNCVVYLLTPSEGEFQWGGHEFEIRHLEHGAAVRIDNEPEVILMEGHPA